MQIYALEIRKTDLPLITFLNGGVEPEIKRDTYLVFQIIDPRSVHSKIMTKRELFNTYDFTGIQPMLLKFKK